MVISGYLDYQSTQFSLYASELAVAVCVWGAGFNEMHYEHYILQALNVRTGLNQLTMSSVTYFISQA